MRPTSLRSPVALVRAETEVALAFPRDAAYYRDTCERILKHSTQMTHLIDQLLALARADAGVDIFQFAPVNLPDLLNETADEFVDRFAEEKIAFDRNIPTAEFWANADFIALKRLLNILIENAWRYTPSGQSVTLHLAVASGVAQITVEDTGIGISEKDREKIFHRFQRIAPPLHGEFSGSGHRPGARSSHRGATSVDHQIGKHTRQRKPLLPELLESHPAPGPAPSELSPTSPNTSLRASEPGPEMATSFPAQSSPQSS